MLTPAQRQVWTALMDFTKAELPKVSALAEERCALGAKIEDLVGLISDGVKLKLPSASTVLTREAFGVERAIERLRRRPGEGPSIADKLSRKDPTILHVLTFFQGEVMYTPVPVVEVLTVVSETHGAKA